VINQDLLSRWQHRSFVHHAPMNHHNELRQHIAFHHVRRNSDYVTHHRNLTDFLEYAIFR